MEEWEDAQTGKNFLEINQKVADLIGSDFHDSKNSASSKMDENFSEKSSENNAPAKSNIQQEVDDLEDWLDDIL